MINERHSFTTTTTTPTSTRFTCNQALIQSQGPYCDGGCAVATAIPLMCIKSVSPSTCANSIYNSVEVNQGLICTDFNVYLSISSGATYKKVSLSNSTDIYISYNSSAWATEIGANNWAVTTHIDLTQRPLNTSPGLYPPIINRFLFYTLVFHLVTGSLPLIRCRVGQVCTIQIPIADWDTGNVLRCRWSTGSPVDECGDICFTGSATSSFSTAQLSTSDCTITWLAAFKPSQTQSTYVAAITVEDFVNNASLVALSSVPLQMLILAYAPLAGVRPNRACIGVPINVTLTETIIAQVYCANSSITEFLTSTPMYMTKTSVLPVGASAPTSYYITMTWTPTEDQYGPQVFCASPIDNKGLSGSQYCINYVVGLGSPDLIQSAYIIGTQSPIGVVFSNQSIFSVQ
ncbi:unnamed protein product, partial [Didymodactylos carnosus]